MLLQNNPYPQDRRVRPEAMALTDAGYHVTVIAPAAPGQPWHEVIDGVHAYRYPAPPGFDGVLGFAYEYAYCVSMTVLLSLMVVIRRRFDVVHAHNPPDLFVFVAAFYKLFGVRFVFDHHDLSPEMYRARFGGRSSRLVYRALIGFEKLSCRLADRVIATNESYKAVEMGRDGVPSGRITVVRNGPSLDRLRPVEPDQRLRRSGKVVIGYVGVMGFQDGIDYLLRALRYLACELGRTDFFCVLIGTGDARASLEALATELQLDELVWFTGAIPDSDLLRYLCAADICVDPDPSNPFNDRSSMIKMSEYMALGKPIVAFDLPEHRVTAQEAASYVSANDEAAFARALAELMDDPGRRARMGARGRERVETALAWPYSIPFLLQAYETLLGSATRATGAREPLSTIPSGK
jgi:glycosyltransferase involved in cell wall biosynthesis